MKVITRYLLRAHVAPFLFAFGALTGVILINTLARQLADLAGKGLSTEVVLHFFVLSLPSNIALTLPMSVLVAVLYTFSQLTAENEILALKAGGVDLKRLVLPVLLVAALIAAGMVWFNDQVLPESNHQWQQLMVDIGRKSPLFALREQSVNQIQSANGVARYYLQAGRIDPTTNRLQDVVIYDVSNARLGRTIYADSGRMAFNAARTDLMLTLFDGHLREIDLDEPASFQRLGFEQQLLRIEGIGNEFERQASDAFRGDREMTAAMLAARTDTLAGELRTVRRDATAAARADLNRVLGSDTTAAAGGAATSASGFEPFRAVGRTGAIAVTEQTAAELRVARDRAASLERQIREFQVEVQKKYSIAAATLVFVLIGVPLALRFAGGGLGMVILVSLSVFALYYVGLIGGETLADEGYLSPISAMWGMNALMMTLGLVGLTRIGRETSSGRGSEIAERWARFQQRFRTRGGAYPSRRSGR